MVLQHQAGAQWVSKANALCNRSEVSSVVYNGKVYTFLGFKDADWNTTPTAEVYDPATNQWTWLDSLPSGKEVTHQGVVLIDDQVWHIGGRVGKNPGPLTSEVWIYNITTNTWSAGPQLLDPATKKPLPWAGGGAALVGRTLHVFGGFAYTACNGDQDVYHLTLNVDEWLANPVQPAPWKNERAPLPMKRNHLSAVVLAGKVYAIGGQFGHDCGGGLDQNYVHVYDPVTDRWAELTPLPTPRSHAEASVFALDGKIYLVAGQGKDNVSTNKVTIFDPAVNSGKGAWTENTSLALPRSYEGLSAKVIGSTFMISHGGEGSSRNARNYTYARSLIRKPVYKLGFSPACATLNAVQGSIVKTNALLFTIDSTTAYSATSNASWLTVSKNAKGIALQNGTPLEFTINTAALLPGTYTAVVTAKGSGFTEANFCVNLTVSAPPQSGTLEAEAATLSGAVIASKHTGFTGSGYADYTNDANDYVEWALESGSADSVVLQFRYANGATDNRPLQLNINGAVVSSSLDFPATGGWTQWSNVLVGAQLVKGTNKIRLTATGYSGPNIDHLLWRMVPVQTQTLEAEDAVLNKAVAASNHSGYSGTGFVDYINATGDYIEWTVHKNYADSVVLQFRYANGSSNNRPLKVEVNGVVVQASLGFPPTGGWAAWSAVNTKAKLTSGVNKIRLTATGYSGPNVDYVKWHLLSLNQTAIAYNRSPQMTAASGFAASLTPNPVAGTAFLLVHTSSELPLRVSITDIAGREFANVVFPYNESGRYMLPVQNLSSGLYFVLVRQSNKVASVRFVVKK